MPVTSTAGGSVRTTAASVPHRLERLDGIRAVAILLVFGAHTIIPWHGWEGVHLFFVLSGFLITGILRRARNDRLFWRPFYIKRATRILPPLVLCLLAGYLLYRPPIGVLALYGAFAANILELTHHRIGGGLVILWSLSVEEHFYLFWPFAIRFLRRRQLLILCGAMLVFEPILRFVAATHFHIENDIYMLTPFQLDGLLVGSMLSLLCEDDSSKAAIARFSRPAAAVLLALYLGLTLFWKPFTLESHSPVFASLGYSLIAFTGAAIIATTYLHPRSLLSRTLSSWPMVFLGTISYGFYLYHLLLLDICGRVLQRIYGYPRFYREMLPGFILTIVVSWLSFHFYEKRLILWGRHRAERLNQRHSPFVPDV